MPLRDRYNAFIERHEVAWELGMGVLALFWVALGFLVDQTPEGLRPQLGALEVAITLVFVAEFTSRLAATHDRRQYLRGHWIDAIALIPQVRGMRLLRLLRLLRLVRAFAGFYRAAMHAERLARHRGFAWLLVAWLTVMAICSALVYAAEHGGPDALIKNPFDALWWGVSTLSTVGYGDTYPKTDEGRLAAMALMLLGIGLFSAITATITSYFLSREGTGTGVAGDDVVGRLQTLSELRAQGSLTEDEYTAAKALVLRVEPDAARSDVTAT